MIDKNFLKENNIKWKLTNKVQKVGYTYKIWCVCKCGVEKWIWLQNLKQLKSKSCLACSNTVHGGSYTRLHRIWGTMKYR